MSAHANVNADRAPVDVRIDALDWSARADTLDRDGNTIIRGLLDADDCAALVASYDDDAAFRKTIVMARHNFGRGEYRYFRYPLPGLIAGLRVALYRRLAPIANRWHAALGEARRYPDTFTEFTTLCHAAGQTRPTPLLLRYTAEDYNCLHQDLYGDFVFPLQAAILLSRPGSDFTGGEFVLTEQRPRMQSRAEVVDLERGDAVIFPVHVRPCAGSRGFYRVNMRHGVSRIRSGTRHTAGIIFHDAA
ncbi:MAG: 2OG-Fe(II) oxygenase [Gammaproteobacteria bacterium]